MLATPRSIRLASAVASSFVIVSLLLLDVFPAATYWLAIAGLGAAVALVVVAITRSADLDLAWLRRRADVWDLVVVVGVYGAVVGGMWLAFGVFGEENPILLFLAFGSALLLGVAAPIFYTVWLRRRPLASLGLTLGNWRATAVLALVFAGVQVALTLPRLSYPATDIWLPLLVMALPVGLFEAVFFRGFVQNRLEASFGLGPAVAGAAALYGLYHVGYGMGLAEIGFLFGLGIVYAAAFRLAGSILVLWPLLTPLGSFYNQVQAADIVMPIESILGFVDLMALMVVAIWLARRHERRRAVSRAVKPAV